MARLKRIFTYIGSIKVRDDVNGHHIDLEFKELLWLVGIAAGIIGSIHLLIYLFEKLT